MTEALDIVRWFNNHSRALELFHQAQLWTNPDRTHPLALILPAPTRWTTHFQAVSHLSAVEPAMKVLFGLIHTKRCNRLYPSTVHNMSLVRIPDSETMQMQVTFQFGPEGPEVPEDPEAALLRRWRGGIQSYDQETEIYIQLLQSVMPYD
ncbi:hypothetical protein L226DRAFT_569337 [Lentinus tigrinus ALCF2SS1-7]|uniref:uncharacterized protein n=1 Tax=Lentinus tigrinus ALCF2SS1-7 TaxID=1328758 RepID=UPI001165CF77|nr:hypothetical protein L226DRAFT_569337 [Lentinus tigrinus ALCF2SS1-7]